MPLQIVKNMEFHYFLKANQGYGPNQPNLTTHRSWTESQRPHTEHAMTRTTQHCAVMQQCARATDHYVRVTEQNRPRTDPELTLN